MGVSKAHHTIPHHITPSYTYCYVELQSFALLQLTSIINLLSLILLFLFLHYIQFGSPELFTGVITSDSVAVTSEAERKGENKDERKGENKDESKGSRVSGAAGDSKYSIKSPAGTVSSSDPSRSPSSSSSSSSLSSAQHSQGNQSSTHALYKWWKTRQTVITPLLFQE